MLQDGERFAGRYSVRSLLGLGTLARAYRAEDQDRGGRQVVLKVLEPQFLKNTLESSVRFRRDAGRLLGLRHENVARFLDHGECDGVPYVVTEFLEGETLAERIHGEGGAGAVPLSDPDLVREILLQIAAGLRCAHALGILHRDVKPANVFLAVPPPRRDDRTEGPATRVAVKVLDCCVARLFDFSRFLARHSVADTFYYMAPEQSGLLKQSVDQRADLYSLGILGYELLCGRLPYDSTDPGALLRQHLIHSPAPVHEINPLVPAALSAVLARLMAKNPGDRYGSAESLLADLLDLRDAPAVSSRVKVSPAGVPGAEPAGLPRKRVHLIERTAELESFRNALERARTARGRMILVEGEAGIGKTRLLEEFVESVPEAGALILYGKCEEYGGRIPYQPYRSVLENLAATLKGWPSDRRDSCLDSVRGLQRELGPFLAQLVPELAGLLRPPAGPPPDAADPASAARDRVHEALCRFLGAVGTPERPLVLVLDDLQWAETEAFDLLEEHLEMLAGQCCMVVCLYRAEDVYCQPHLVRLRGLITSLPEKGGILSPKALSPEGVRAFVRASLSDEGSGLQGLCKEVARISRGNPFILREALQALLDRAVLKQDPEDGSWSCEQGRLHLSMISSNVVELILRRIEGLSPRARHVLAVCAALRGNVSFERLLPLTGLQEYDLLDRLEEAVRQQFIEEVPGGEDRILYPFVHDKIREAVYNQTPADTKREIHRRIAEHLEGMPEPERGGAVFDLAHHYLQAGDLPRVLPWLLRAGDDSWGQNAHREAVRHYEEALKILPREDPGSGSLCEKLGDLYTILGEYDRALECYGMIPPLPGAVLDRARWNRKLGTVYHKKGDTTHAVRHLEEALAELGRRPYMSSFSTLAAILVQTLRQALLPWVYRPSRRTSGRRGKGEAAGRIVELACIYRELTYLYSFSDMLKAVHAHLLHFRFAVHTGEPALLADAFRFHGLYLAHMRRFKKGLKYLKRSRDICRELGDDWGMASTECYLAIWNLYQGKLAEARRGLEAGIEGLQKSEDRWELETAYVHLASVLWAQGENRRALECFQRIRRMAAQGGDERGELSAHTGLGMSWGLLGEEESAEAHFREARRICLRSGHPFFRVSYSWMYGAFCTMRARLDEGMRALEEAVRTAAENRLFSYYAIPPFFVYADACLKKAQAATEKGERASWIRTAGSALRKGRLLGMGFPLYAASYRVLQGVYSSVRGRRRRAGASFRKGIRLVRDMGAEVLLAQALEEYAAHLARHGALEAGEETLSRAREIYREKGLRLHYLRAGGQEETRGAQALPVREASHVAAGTVSILEEPMLTPESRAFSTLMEASRLITETLDLREVLERIMDLSVHCLGAERGLLLLEEPGENPGGDAAGPPPFWVPDVPLQRIVSRNMDQDVLGGRGFEGGLRIIREAARTRQGMLVRDAREDFLPGNDGGSPEGTPRSVLCLPLIHEGRLLGILYLDNHRVTHLFSPGDLEFLESLASFALIAIRNARAFEDARRQRDEIQRLKDRLQEEIVHLKEEIGAEHHFQDIVGTGAAMQRVFRFIEQAAPTEQPVLVMGETGTGKELVARAVHRLSPRCAGPFVKVNCAALPGGLLESELFGHEKGAFTGAIRRKLGRFELADGGTLFLDEIGELPPELQAKLLRVLQDMEFERIGGTRTLRADVRIVAATNRVLPDELKRGKFREDLYYRLNVLPVGLPPLRERTEDIPLLVSYFIDRFNKQLDRDVRGLDQETLDAARRYRWPGNVRELENLVERAMVLSSGPILSLVPYLFPEHGTPAPGTGSEPGSPDGPAFMGGDYYQSVDAFKRRLIQEALRQAGGSRGHAARQLGMAPSYLSRLLKNLGVKEEP